MIPHQSQLEITLRDSINCYTHILQHLQDVDARLELGAHDELLDLNQSLERLQKMARQFDQTILEHSPHSSAKDETIGSLVEERAVIIKKILICNKMLTKKAMGIRSLLTHEMATLRSGFSAIKGYSQQRTNEGRFVNSSS